MGIHTLQGRWEWGRGVGTGAAIDVLACKDGYFNTHLKCFVIEVWVLLGEGEQ